MSRPEKDDSYVSKNQMAESIIVLLGGRVAEKLILDDISTGASNDLERATSTARAMVTRYGFSDNLGPIVYGRGDHEVFLGRDYSATPDYSDAVAAEIDHEIRTVVEDAFEKCEAILKEHIDKLHELAGYLMEHEKIDGETFKKLMEGNLIVDSDVNNAEDIKPESESVEESED
jgi:cell division protease FtsH